MREAAQVWLKQKQIMHKTLSGSSDKGRQTLIGRCSRCNDCSRSWCFSCPDPCVLVVERFGECTTNLNLDKIRQFNADLYASKYSPSIALKKMMEAGVPQDQRPNASQLKNRRPEQKDRQKSCIQVDCIGELRRFVEDPPDNISILKDFSFHPVMEEYTFIFKSCNISFPQDNWACQSLTDAGNVHFTFFGHGSL